MNFCSLFSFLLAISNKNFVVNPPCQHCAFYKIDNGRNLCCKYGEKNDLFNTIDFYDAVLCRNDELRCGREGRHFVEKNETMVMVR